MDKAKRDSLLEMSRGAIIERVDYETRKIFENLEDPNTDYKAKRKIQVTLVFQADDDSRESIKMSTEAKTTLAPTVPIVTRLYMVRDEKQQSDDCGSASRRRPGQLDMDGVEAEEA